MEDFTKLRELMVEEQLRDRGIKDKRVFKAMESIERHLFIGEHLRDKAAKEINVAKAIRGSVSRDASNLSFDRLPDTKLEM